MIYDVAQTTSYAYANAVPFGQHVLRMTPLDRLGQKVLASGLAIDPRPVEQRVLTDFFGNTAVQIEIATAHRKLVVTSTARVRVDALDPLIADLTPPWERIREAALASRDLAPHSPVHFLFPSRLAEGEAAITAYAVESFPPGRPIFAAALDLMGRIHRDFAYAPGATDVRTLPAEAFRLKRGVCQDFAHVMIAGLRGLGLPAAYVSGYLRTIPPPGRERLAGVDATHAWAAVWCGADAGWRGLDPTNDLATDSGEDHIVLAVGRDYLDVAPVGGIILFSGQQRLHVGVDIVPLEPLRAGRGAVPMPGAS